MFNITHYQFSSVSSVTQSCPTLNPATLIPNSSEPPIHTYKEALEDLMSHFSHISSTPLNNPDFTGYIGGSSSMTSERKKVAGYAIVSDTEIIESQPLSLGTSSQKVELYQNNKQPKQKAGKRPKQTLLQRRHTDG